MRWIAKFFVAVLALLLVLEEWLWDALKAQLHRLSQLPLVHRAEGWLRSLPPWASVLIMLLPALVLLPFKVLGLWALAHRHPLLGVGIVLLAKLTGTALAAYLFDLVRDNARKIGWFDMLYCAIRRLLARAHAWLESQAAYQRARATLHRARIWLHTQWEALRGSR